MKKMLCCFGLKQPQQTEDVFNKAPAKPISAVLAIPDEPSRCRPSSSCDSALGPSDEGGADANTQSVSPEPSVAEESELLNLPSHHSHWTRREFLDLVMKTVSTGDGSQFSRQDILGQGSFAKVYLATDSSSEKKVVIKKMRAKFSHKLHVALMELRILRSTRHPNIVSYINSFYVEDQIWLVMEHMAGGSLGSLLEQAQLPLRPRAIACVAKQALAGLEHLHTRGLVHRDVKSDNLLIGANGVVKIADFGVSCQLDPQGFAQGYAGTVWWMAPEVLGKTRYTSSVDCWSLGMTCLEMVYGEPAYAQLSENEVSELIISKGKPSFELKDKTEAQRALINFLDRALEAEPVQRWSSSQLLQHSFLDLAEFADRNVFYLLKSCQSQ